MTRRPCPYPRTAAHKRRQAAVAALVGLLVGLGLGCLLGV